MPANPEFRLVPISLLDLPGGAALSFDPHTVESKALPPGDTVWFDLLSGKFAIPADDGEPVLISRAMALEILESDLTAAGRGPLVVNYSCRPYLPPLPGSPLFGLATSESWNPGSARGALSLANPKVRAIMEMDVLRGGSSPLGLGQYVRSWLFAHGHLRNPLFANPAYTVWSHDLSLIVGLARDVSAAFRCTTHAVCMEALSDPDPDQWPPMVRRGFSYQQVIGGFVLVHPAPGVQAPINGNRCWRTLAAYSSGRHRADGEIIREALK